jgi:hypothetical protein
MASKIRLLIRKPPRETQARKRRCQPLLMGLSLLFCKRNWYFRRSMKPIFLVILILALARKAAAAEKILFAEDFAQGISNGWQNVAFFKTPTDYAVVHDDTNSFVRGVAEKTCSALSIKLNLAPRAKLKLRWRWKIDGVNPNGSERDLKKFDHAARVFVAFDTLIGPPRTLNYLWANVETPGTVLAHPKSSRAQIFVLESGDAKAGQWLTEERDVVADWKRVFPDKPMPKIVGLGLMTDSDSLGKKLTGDYAAIELIGE